MYSSLKHCKSNYNMHDRSWQREKAQNQQCIRESSTMRTQERQKLKQVGMKYEIIFLWHSRVIPLPPRDSKCLLIFSKCNGYTSLRSNKWLVRLGHFDVFTIWWKYPDPNFVQSFSAIKAHRRTRKGKCPVTLIKIAAITGVSWKNTGAYRTFVAKFRL